ncbi:MAG: hypothetical protein JOZ07_05595 [Solirubrobacterales bacterium]|nr:hypothetical protein [Solirubrobacterales bacterium]
MQSFYSTAAEVAGALIGLLFVAVSVAQAQIHEEASSASHRISAAAALSLFTNSLFLSLLGLIERGHIAIPAAAGGIAGILFVLALLLSLVGGTGDRTRDVLILGLLAATFTAELIVGLRSTAAPAAPATQQAIAILIVVCFLSGITRSWELIGGQPIGLAAAGAAIPALLRRWRVAVAKPLPHPSSATGSRTASSSTGACVNVTWTRWFPKSLAGSQREP